MLRPRRISVVRPLLVALGVIAAAWVFIVVRITAPPPKATLAPFARLPHAARDAPFVASFEEKLVVRRQAENARSRGQRTDEVVYLVTTPKEGPHCTAALARETIKSAAQLRASCQRCDFDVVLIADAQLYSFFSSKEFALATERVFDYVRRFEPAKPATSASVEIFAGYKPEAILRQGLVSAKPFMLFMDSDIYAFHADVPEAVFDMLHAEYDLVQPYDWAHRHGEAWGRGMPGLCTCFMGMINSNATRRLVERWVDEVDKFHDPYYTIARESLLGKTAEPNMRDQELYTVALHKHRLLDIKLNVLAQDWVCPNGRYASHQWIDAVSMRDPNTKAEVTTEIRRRSCRAIHSHSWGQGRAANKRPAWGSNALWAWVDGLFWIEASPQVFAKLSFVSKQANESCGGNIAAYRKHSTP